MEKLASHHLAAPLYAHFLNGIVVGYLPGRTVSVDDLKDPRMQKYVLLNSVIFGRTLRLFLQKNLFYYGCLS